MSARASAGGRQDAFGRKVRKMPGGAKDFLRRGAKEVKGKRKNKSQAGYDKKGTKCKR